MKKSLFVITDNTPEVLMRITGLLRRKGLQVKNLSMNEMENPSRASLAITFTMENQRLSEIIFNMKKLEEVHKVEEREHFEIISLPTSFNRGKSEEYKMAINY